MFLDQVLEDWVFIWSPSKFERREADDVVTRRLVGNYEKSKDRFNFQPLSVTTMVILAEFLAHRFGIRLSWTDSNFIACS